MKRFKLLTLTVIAGLVFSSCSDDELPYYPPPGPPVVEGEVIGQAEIWVTTGDKTSLLVQGEDLDIIDNPTTPHASIIVDPAQKYQEIDGFGAALTGSSAYLINQLDPASKAALLNDLFDVENGIGISYLRMTIGASDFSLSDYTYNDLDKGEEDPELSKFTIAKDQQDIIPVFKDILKINPELKIMGSPWSAPAWMKTNQSLYGGSLKPKWYDTYANYFVRYIEAYEEQGISIDAITPQNEPLHEADYPSMRMEAAAQADFIKHSLGPVFEASGIQTKIVAYDHNFDEPGYPISIYEDPQAAQYIDGAAFHAYAGDVSAMTRVHQAFPDKSLYFTEISGGQWATDFSENLKWNTKNITMGATRNWSKNALFWNLALDENYGPTNNGCSDCRGVVTITSSGQIQKNVEYYSIAHFSRFVRPGAHRIASGDFDSDTGLSNVAFENTDGSKVLVVLNESSSTRTFSVIIDQTSYTGEIPPNALMSIVWE